MKLGLVLITVLACLVMLTGCGANQPHLQITTTTLPVMRSGVPVHMQMQAAGCAADQQHWSTENALPQGLVLDEGGLIHGIPVNNTQEVEQWPVTFLLSCY